jgi:hypothetical protein
MDWVPSASELLLLNTETEARGALILRGILGPTAHDTTTSLYFPISAPPTPFQSLLTSYFLLLCFTCLSPLQQDANVVSMITFVSWRDWDS